MKSANRHGRRYALDAALFSSELIDARSGNHPGQVGVDFALVMSVAAHFVHVD
jgi:hypothetical protein